MYWPFRTIVRIYCKFNLKQMLEFYFRGIALKRHIYHVKIRNWSMIHLHKKTTVISPFCECLFSGNFADIKPYQNAYYSLPGLTSRCVGMKTYSHTDVHTCIWTHELTFGGYNGSRWFIYLLPGKHLKTGQYRSFSETLFEWRFFRGPMVTRHCVEWVRPLSLLYWPDQLNSNPRPTRG